MRKIFEHERFWLFAPFVGLLALGFVTFGLWHLAAARLSDEMAALGIGWQSVERHGYPARISLDMTGFEWRDGARRWKNDALSITMMPFQGGHAIADFHGHHEIQTPRANLQLAHQGNLASVVVDIEGLARASFEVENPQLSAQLKHSAQTHSFTAQKIGLHGLRAEKPAHYKVAFVSKDLRLPAAFGRAANKPITRLDVLSVLPARLLQDRSDSEMAGQILVLERLTLERDGLTLIARGTLKLKANGYVDGRLDIDAIKMDALLDLLEEFEVVSARDRAKWLFFGGLGAALGGNTQDRISVPLQFKDGRTFLGPLDLGNAPRWQ